MNRDLLHTVENALAQVGIFAEIGNMTPREILLLLDAHTNRVRASEYIAWRIGQYVAVALHSPDRYPQPPHRAMSDCELQSRIRSVARDGKEISHALQ